MAVHQASENPANQSAAVIDISGQWGYKNASHFARAFKAEYGIAPHELRVLARPN